MGWELEAVEKPFVEQLLTMGWRYVEGDLDAPARTGRTGFTEVIQETTLRRQLRALNLDATAIRGNQELPKVMYIVPWKEPATAELAGRPVNSLVEEALAPVDREVFRRQTRYFSQLYGAAGPAGGDPAGTTGSAGADTARDAPESSAPPKRLDCPLAFSRCTVDA